MNDSLSDQGEQVVCSCDYDGVRLCHVMPPERCQGRGNDPAVAIGRLETDEEQR